MDTSSSAPIIREVTQNLDKVQGEMNKLDKNKTPNELKSKLETLAKNLDQGATQLKTLESTVVVKHPSDQANKQLMLAFNNTLNMINAIEKNPYLQVQVGAMVWSTFLNKLKGYKTRVPVSARILKSLKRGEKSEKMDLDSQS